MIVCPPSRACELIGHVRTVKPGDRWQVGEIKIEAAPSYNTNKPNHHQAAGNVGYVVERPRANVSTDAGHTDLIPEMAEIRCDVALLPMGGKYTMNAEEAAQAAERMVRQKWWYPCTGATSWARRRTSNACLS